MEKIITKIRVIIVKRKNHLINFRDAEREIHNLVKAELRRRRREIRKYKEVVNENKKTKV